MLFSGHYPSSLGRGDSSSSHLAGDPGCQGTGSLTQCVKTHISGIFALAGYALYGRPERRGSMQSIKPAGASG
jgi:hypothetical protein